MAQPAQGPSRVLLPLIFFAIACHASDLIGTYIAQPSFQQARDPIYLIVKGRESHLDWLSFILIKVGLILTGAVLTWIWVKVSRKFYPDPGESIGKFYVHTYYQRDISLLQSLLSMPKKFTPGLLLLGPVFLLVSPYYAVLGYEQLAPIYGWPMLAPIRISGVFADWSLLPIAVVAYIVAVYIAFLDYRATTAPHEIEESAQPQLSPQ